MPAFPATCIHSATGLCPECRSDYREDPAAWAEWGNHPAGLANRDALSAEYAAWSASLPTDAEVAASLPTDAEVAASCLAATGDEVPF